MIDQTNLIFYARGFGIFDYSGLIITTKIQPNKSTCLEEKQLPLGDDSSQLLLGHFPPQEQGAHLARVSEYLLSPVILDARRRQLFALGDGVLIWCTGSLVP